ncbi:unnamed protein product [Tuber aestivum]|uniref:Uncharacterized protein n=1 Tax=Tuber aestivum TaxID=59557 RepID=A0A292Q3F6_9PEZI|nr:unnamed protein product [Tuber aestivum]
MEPTRLKQSSSAPTIRYSIEELLEYRNSLSHVICPIDGFTLVAWAEGLLDKIGDYVPQELAARKQYAKKVTAVQVSPSFQRLVQSQKENRRQTVQAANPFNIMSTEEAEPEGLSKDAIGIAEKRRIEYAGLTFADFLNLGKYGSPTSSQEESVSGSHSEKRQVTPPFVQVKSYILPKETGPKGGASAIGPIQKDTHSRPTPGMGTGKPSTTRESVEDSLDGEIQASSHDEVPKATPFGEAVEEPKESGDIVDQDAWINEMLERTKIFAGNKYKRT